MTFSTRHHSSGQYSLSLGFGFKSLGFVVKADDRDRHVSRPLFGFSLTLGGRGQFSHRFSHDDNPIDAYGCFSACCDGDDRLHSEMSDRRLKLGLVGAFFGRFFSHLHQMQNDGDGDRYGMKKPDRIMEMEIEDDEPMADSGFTFDPQQIIEMTIGDAFVNNNNNNLEGVNLNPAQPSTIEEMETDPITNPGDVPQEDIDLILETMEEMDIVPIRVMEMDADNNGTIDVVAIGEDANDTPVAIAAMEQDGMTVMVDLESGSTMAMGDSNNMVLL